jgi:alkanesulfonate monooxygenase SsuD/methylene tetrahydromethanopterin reductase-like flavin-dependent oxidoreductase (luciferase family)
LKFGLFGGATVTGAGDGSDSPQQYRAFIDYVLEAEQLGFHSVFLVEHHFTGFNQVSASISLLTYLAAKTSTMRLGTAVAVLPWHNPVLLAEQAATLDLLSDGRFDFGIGKGYRWNEFAGFCVPAQEADARFAEALEVIRKSWTSKGRFSHHGRYWHYEDIVVEPSPVTSPHPPMWMAAGSPGGIEWAASQEFRLLLDQFCDARQAGERIRTYRRAVEATGRQYLAQSVGLTRALHVALNQSERDRAHEQRAQFLRHVASLTNDPRGRTTLAIPMNDAEIRAGTERSALIGTPDEIVARLQDLQECGVDYVLMLDVGGDPKALRTFAREVMPAFHDRAARQAA